MGIPARRAVAKNGHRATAWFEVREVDKVALIPLCQTLPPGGDRDWTRREVDFTPSPKDPFLPIKLCAEGTGTAWFDDLELVEVAR